MSIPRAKVRGFEVAKGFEDAGVTLPTQATVGSAGYDFYALEDVSILPSQAPVLIKTGVKSYMRKDEVLNLFIRSSVALKQSLVLANGVGVVDATYYSNPDNDGHIMFMLFNAGKAEVAIKKGDRIGQGVFVNYLSADSGNSTKERKGGFGHSGT